MDKAAGVSNCVGDLRKFFQPKALPAKEKKRPVGRPSHAAQREEESTKRRL
jgi:hypothetical protein